MKWKRWLKFDPYKKLWFWAGKPFTFWRRDIYHNYEYVNIILYIVLGYLLAMFQRNIIAWLSEVWWHFPVFFLVLYTYGFLHGHFFFNSNETWTLEKGG